MLTRNSALTGKTHYLWYLAVCLIVYAFIFSYIFIFVSFGQNQPWNTKIITPSLSSMSLTMVTRFPVSACQRPIVFTKNISLPGFHWLFITGPDIEPWAKGVTQMKQSWSRTTPVWIFVRRSQSKRAGWSYLNLYWLLRKVVAPSIVSLLWLSL